MNEPDQAASVACSAEDYPVWADGSQDRMVCTLPVGHEEHHHDETEGWEWSLDAHLTRFHAGDRHA